MKCNYCVVVHWQRLLDEARADGQAQARTRERWLRRQAQESATFIGTVLDLAEAAIDVVIVTTAGRRHLGSIVGLGIDVVVLADVDGHVAVRLPSVSFVRPSPGAVAGPATGDRVAALDLTFAELLARFVDDEPEVAVAAIDGETTTGTLISVGLDVVTIRVAPGADGIAYCSTVSLSSVRFRSG